MSAKILQLNGMKIILCQNCHQNPMQVSYTHISNGNRQDYLLCANCARKLQMQERFAEFSNQSVENQDIASDEKDSVEKNLHKEISLPAQDSDELKIVKSKILALTLQKEAAVATENYEELVRVEKVLNELYEQKGKLEGSL